MKKTVITAVALAMAFGAASIASAAATSTAAPAGTMAPAASSTMKPAAAASTTAKATSSTTAAKSSTTSAAPKGARCRDKTTKKFAKCSAANTEPVPMKAASK